jgi:anti-sigma regulatory factor (Ser/Thr protein kinase)
MMPRIGLRSRLEGVSMASELRLSFPATISGLVASLEAMDHAGIALNLTPALVSRVRIVVEELFSNTIKYGYGGECERPVRLHLSTDTSLTIAYEDDAPPFDPTARAREDDASIMDEDRPEGRAGIAMVLGLCATTKYMPRPDGNCLIMTFRLA